jgi:hypothetical protein
LDYKYFSRESLRLIVSAIYCAYLSSIWLLFNLRVLHTVLLSSETIILRIFFPGSCLPERSKDVMEEEFSRRRSEIQFVLPSAILSWSDIALLMDDGIDQSDTREFPIGWKYGFWYYQGLEGDEENLSVILCILVYFRKSGGGKCRLLIILMSVAINVLECFETSIVRTLLLVVLRI